MVKRKKNLTILCIVVFAFMFRVVVGIKKVSLGLHIPIIEVQNWWDNGYTLYTKTAINFAEGRGFNFYDPFAGVVWSRRPPLYPLLLSLEYALFGKSNLVPILVQSFIGTASVFMCYMIAREIYSEKAGLIAASMAMIYPYYVSHDSALQETSLFTLLVAVSVYFLLRSSSSDSYRDYVFLGLSIGLSSLCKESIVVFIPFAILWVYLNCRCKFRQITIRVLLVLAAFFIVITPWLVRNTLIHGKPVFSISSGIALWQGNNPYTLTSYPRESIDKSAGMAMSALSKSDRAKLLDMGEVKYDRWHLDRALDFIKENPLTIANYAITKVFTFFSPLISPAGKSPLRSILYTVSYTPILLLAFVAAILCRSRWRKLSIFYFLFLSFAGISAVFWAHTAHRVYLDIYLMVLSSYSVLHILGSLGVGWAKGASEA